MHWPRGHKAKGQGHTVTKTVTVARLLVMRAATAVCCCCRCGSACRYDCQCFLVVFALTDMKYSKLVLNLLCVVPWLPLCRSCMRSEWSSNHHLELDTHATRRYLHTQRMQTYYMTPEINISVQSKLAKGRIADLSLFATAKGFVRS